MKKEQTDNLKKHLEYAQAYCSRQERTIKDVKYKLADKGLNEKEIENIVKSLIKEDYLNEKRYTELFVRSKINQSHWGRIKIKRMLLFKGVSVSNINSAFADIDEDNYKEILKGLFEKKLSTLKVDDSYQKKYRLQYYLTSHGFENELIDELLQQNNL